MQCQHCGDHEGDPLCESCRAVVVDALRRAPALYVRAHTNLGSRGQQLSEHVSSSAPGSRSPLRDDLLELSDTMARLLTYWHARMTRTPVRTGRSGAALQRAAVALSNDLDAALAVWRGHAYARHVVARVGALRHHLGETPLVHQLAAPCPSCDTRALIRKDGAERVECRMCGNTWPEERYELLTRALAADLGKPTDKGHIQR